MAHTVSEYITQWLSAVLRFFNAYFLPKLKHRAVNEALRYHLLHHSERRLEVFEYNDLYLM